MTLGLLSLLLPLACVFIHLLYSTGLPVLGLRPRHVAPGSEVCSASGWRNAPLLAVAATRLCKAESEHRKDRALLQGGVGEVRVFVTRCKCLLWCLTRETVMGSWAVGVTSRGEAPSPGIYPDAGVFEQNLQIEGDFPVHFWIPGDWPWLCLHLCSPTLSRLAFAY